MTKGSHDLDRVITTRMSANIVADLLKMGFTLPAMADALKVREDYVRRVQRKLHSFTFRDIRRLAKLPDTTPHLLLFNSIRPIPADVRELFDSTRQMLETGASVDSRFRKRRKRRSSRTKAA